MAVLENGMEAPGSVMKVATCVMNAAGNVMKIRMYVAVSQDGLLRNASRYRP